MKQDLLAQSPQKFRSEEHLSSLGVPLCLIALYFLIFSLPDKIWREELIPPKLMDPIEPPILRQMLQAQRAKGTGVLLSRVKVTLPHWQEPESLRGIFLVLRLVKKLLRMSRKIDDGFAREAKEIRSSSDFVLNVEMF